MSPALIKGKRIEQINLIRKIDSELLMMRLERFDLMIITQALLNILKEINLVTNW
ncbi:hypothetical protein [Vulcanisaeta distributa]|uniref:hypothetical protein n=1 Tax=Vulcanisaeta distributa TaxID=164451 RepID=UPI000B24A228|nr:hypothetical protein [Vulcanisaeta distributa]